MSTNVPTTLDRQHNELGGVLDRDGWRHGRGRLVFHGGDLGNLKAVEEVVACVVDYGSFIAIADKLSETMAKVYYYSPFEQEFQNVRDCVKGDGLDKVIRLDHILDPDVLPTIDLFIFPDIGFEGLQRHLKSLGKAVWGNMGATDLELYRDVFLGVLKEVGLPAVHSQEITGLSNLAKYLKENEHKWVKINRFRANMETWHHQDYQHSLRTLDSLAVILGGTKEHVIFVVQDDIKSDMEVGYDGWCIDGKFPPLSFQGYEKKNELYLGSALSEDELPDEIRVVNEAMAPVLANYGYRNWWATEIRIADGIPYFIDPTARMPGQTGEHQLESIENFADIIWQGANGVIVKPKLKWKFAAEATLHYEQQSKDIGNGEEWKTLHFPPKVLPWVKLYHYCILDGVYHFPPHHTDEVGVIIGGGDSIQDAIKNLVKNLEMLKGLPLHANAIGFANLVATVKEAEEQGIPFGTKVPTPETINQILPDD